MRICDCIDYETEKYHHAYIALGGIYVGYRQIHQRGYEWVTQYGFMMIVRPKQVQP